MPDSDDRVRVHVDFNDMDSQGRFYVLPEDISGELALHSQVTLYDAEGNSAQGVVAELLTGHKAMIAMIPGSWERRWVAASSEARTIQDQVMSLLAPYLRISRPLSGQYQLTVISSSIAPRTATPPSALPQPEGAVLSSL